MRGDDQVELESRRVRIVAGDKVLQLTSLLPAAEQFAILLRDALKSQVCQSIALLSKC